MVPPRGRAPVRPRPRPAHYLGNLVRDRRRRPMECSEGHAPRSSDVSTQDGNDAASRASADDSTAPARDAAVPLVHRAALPRLPVRRATDPHHPVADQAHRRPCDRFAAAAGLPQPADRRRPRLEGERPRDGDRDPPRRDDPCLSAKPGEHLDHEPGRKPHDARHAGPPVPPDATPVDRVSRHERHRRFRLPDPE